MPKVTLNAHPTNNRTILFGRVKYFFRGGDPQEVPVAVALHCQKMTDRKGDPMFTVTDLDTVIVSDEAQVETGPRRITQRRLIEATKCH
jgi:hypothetical protein